MKFMFDHDVDAGYLIKTESKQGVSFDEAKKQAITAIANEILYLAAKVRVLRGLTKEDFTSGRRKEFRI